jgi:hypothetical protein
MVFIFSLKGNLPTANTAQEAVYEVILSTLGSLAIWRIGWVIPYVLGGGPAK